MLRNIHILRRYQQIITIVGRFGFGELADRLDLAGRLKLRQIERTQHPKKPRALRFRMMLEQLGPTFIKLGQILSTRPDLLPADIVQELANLQDNVTASPWETVKTVIEEALGNDPKAVFREFSTEPLASASIAQVYKATLHSGETVAVKIVRPGTRESFELDLQIIEDIGGLIQTHIDEAQHVDVDSIIRQFRSSVHHELDLCHEGRNADIFRAHFEKDRTVAVPRIFWEYSSRSVLVMEYMGGKKLADFLNDDVELGTRKLLAERGANAVLKQVFEHGFFQADPHPGNAMVMAENVICFLDFGMFGRLDDNSMELLAQVMHAIVKKDVDRLLRAARDLDVLSPETPITRLRVRLADMLEQYHGIPLKQISVPRLFQDIFSLISEYHLQFRTDFIFLIKALSTIEATGRQLDPDFDMLNFAAPYVRKLYMRRFAPRQLMDGSLFFAEDMARLLKESPDHMLEILRNMRRGRVGVDFHHRGLEEPLREMNRMADKLTLGVIIAAIIIASSIMAHVGLGPTLLGLPVIGGFGFLVAGITGLWIIFDILRNRRR